MFVVTIEIVVMVVTILVTVEVLASHIHVMDIPKLIEWILFYKIWLDIV